MNFIRNNLIKSYKKININNFNCVVHINTSKYITDKLKISNRVGELCTKEFYVLLKNHTPTPKAKHPTSIINPARSEIRRISKVILERINKQIKNHLGIIQ